MARRTAISERVMMSSRRVKPRRVMLPVSYVIGISVDAIGTSGADIEAIGIASTGAAIFERFAPGVAWFFFDVGAFPVWIAAIGSAEECFDALCGRGKFAAVVEGVEFESFGESTDAGFGGLDVGIFLSAEDTWDDHGHDDAEDAEYEQDFHESEAAADVAGVCWGWVEFVFHG
jgi:hypothetical protein